ncbi:unnamed protein product [Knipowitschia caucasica]|uniref:Uncharacterized protein n=1 Tax=Knipowitschia caucasica TaxID=637954 RepID=A0AAV2JKD2_KNICA
MAGRRLTFHSPSTPLGRDPQITASPQTDDKRLLIAISGLSRQINLNTADIKEHLDSVDSRLLSLEEKLVALELNSAGETNSDKRRRVRNPKLAESVRRLHNSETNSRRYEPEQGLISPRNEAVTSFLLDTISASPHFHDVDKDVIVSACKTYYEYCGRTSRRVQLGVEREERGCWN